MATEEWVSTDNEIWNWDSADDFIWIPADILTGEGRWVAKSQVFNYIANINTYRFVANDDEPFRFVANKE